jgi:DNA-binding NarL/FixJ family response regulator
MPRGEWLQGLGSENGEDALHVAKSYSGTIDVLVTDVIMPRVMGLELARRIGRLHPNVAVVFMSGYSKEALAESGLSTEIKVTLIQKPFIQKPFDPEVLVAGYDNCLRRGSLGPTPPPDAVGGAGFEFLFFDVATRRPQKPGGFSRNRADYLVDAARRI